MSRIKQAGSSNVPRRAIGRDGHVQLRRRLIRWQLDEFALSGDVWRLERNHKIT